MKKAAVIGANSYIARNLIAVLREHYPGTGLKLYGLAEAHADGAEEYRRLDMTDPEQTAGLDLDCDAVFFFTGKTGTANGFDDYETFVRVNEIALLNLLNEYRRQGSSAKIIFPSTRLVYQGRPGMLSEDAEKEFKTIYAVNKFACEQYLEQYHRMFGVRYCVFRICVPYGTLVPGASSYGTAEFMIDRASKGQDISLYGDGSVRRTLTYVGDIARALIEGACSEACANDVFNVGGEDYSLREMAELIAPKFGVGVVYTDWPEAALKIESGDTVFDDSKLRSALRFRYGMTFAEWCAQKERI